MKTLVKVKIKRIVRGGITYYDYPESYDGKKIEPVNYESCSVEGLSNIRARGNVDEYMIGAVNKEDILEFLSIPDIIEVKSSEL